MYLFSSSDYQLQIILWLNLGYHYRDLLLHVNAQCLLDQKPTSATLTTPEYLSRSQTELDTIPLHRGLYYYI